MNDGQHRDNGPANNNGQRSTKSPGVVVGQGWGGGNEILSPGPSGDITTAGDSAGGPGGDSDTK